MPYDALTCVIYLPHAGCSARIAIYLSAKFLLQHKGILPTAAPDRNKPAGTAADFQPLPAASSGPGGAGTMRSAVKALLEDYAIGTRLPKSKAEALGAAGLVFGCTGAFGSIAGCSEETLPPATYRLAMRAALGLAFAAQMPGFPRISAMGRSDTGPGTMRVCLEPARYVATPSCPPGSQALFDASLH